MSDFERIDTYPPTEKIIPIESEWPDLRGKVPEIETPMRDWQIEQISKESDEELIYRVTEKHKKKKCQK